MKSRDPAGPGAASNTRARSAGDSRRARAAAGRTPPGGPLSLRPRPTTGTMMTGPASHESRCRRTPARASDGPADPGPRHGPGPRIQVNEKKKLEPACQRPGRGTVEQEPACAVQIGPQTALCLFSQPKCKFLVNF